MLLDAVPNHFHALAVLLPRKWPGLDVERGMTTLFLPGIEFQSPRQLLVTVVANSYRVLGLLNQKGVLQNFHLQIEEVTLRLTVGQSVTRLGPMTRFYFSLSFVGKLHCSSSWGALSDKRTGL
jgi:hypothetical protein